MKLLSAIALALFVACALHAGPIYLLGLAGNDNSDSHVHSINESNLAVGDCAVVSNDHETCYWDLNEQPFLFTSSHEGVMISAYVLNPHNVPYPPCTFAASEISDIDDTGQILGNTYGIEFPGCTQYLTGQLPNFTGWTPLADLSLWTHVPTLANSNWVVTNGDNPFGSSNYMAHVDAVPEPSTLVLLGAALGAIHVYRRRRSLGSIPPQDSASR